MTAHPWATHDLIVWHPNSWSSLPGFAEAATRGFRESPQPPKPPKPSTPRVRRSLADLTTERDALVVKRDALMPKIGALPGGEGPLDHGALSGVRRKPNSADRKRDGRTDDALARYAEYTRRIEGLEFRMKKEG